MCELILLDFRGEKGQDFLMDEIAVDRYSGFCTGGRFIYGNMCVMLSKRGYLKLNYRLKICMHVIKYPIHLFKPKTFQGFSLIAYKQKLLE